MTDTELDLSTIDQMLQRFGRAGVTAARKNQHSFANESYHLTTDGGDRLVLRVLKTQEPAGARADARMQRLLAKAEVRSPIYLESLDGDVVAEHDGRWFAVSPELEGAHPTSRTIALARDMGSTLARLHDALDPELVGITPTATQWLARPNVERSITACNPTQRAALAPLWSTAELDPTLPMAVVHGDFRVDNLFAENDRVTAVFDLETAEHTTRLLDLARSHLSLTFDGTLDSAAVLDALCAGYDRSAAHPLGADEREALATAMRYCAVACAAWLFTNGGEHYAERFVELGATFHT